MKEKKVYKTKFTLTDKSQLTRQTLHDVIADKINYVVDKVRNEKPHFAWLSKYQLVKSSAIFNTLDEQHPVRIPLFGAYKNPGHMSGRMPSYNEREYQERKIGYTVKWPPPGIFDCIQTVFREIEDIVNGTGDVLMVPCRGYIDQKSRLIEPSWYTGEFASRNMISGYIIYRIDPFGLRVVNEYLTNPDTPTYVKLQMLRAKITGPQLRDAKRATSEAMEQKAINRFNAYVDSLQALTTDVEEPDWNKIRGIAPTEVEDDD